MPLTPDADLAAAEHFDEMVVDDLDDHLRRRHRAQYLLPKRLLADRGDKVPDHGKRHIGLEQRDPDLAQGGPDIGLGQRTMAAQPVEYVGEAITEAVEHPVLDAHSRQQKRQCAKFADWGPGYYPGCVARFPGSAAGT